MTDTRSGCPRNAEGLESSRGKPLASKVGDGAEAAVREDELGDDIVRVENTQDLVATSRDDTGSEGTVRRAAN